jgi:hypothetical protein
MDDPRLRQLLSPEALKTESELNTSVLAVVAVLSADDHARRLILHELLQLPTVFEFVLSGEPAPFYSTV